MVEVSVIGAGLAGSEAAWQLAQRGFRVRLREMRPLVATGAHRSDRCAEIVCSNSFGADTTAPARETAPTSASALLKAELRLLGSLLLSVAEQTRVPAGLALAVDREEFSSRVTAALLAHPRIAVERGEVADLEGAAVLATGPLTSPALASHLQNLVGTGCLHFFDAAAPLVTRESLDMDQMFAASRYGKGDGVYLNAPFDQARYERFQLELTQAENTVLHLAAEHDPAFFEGCLPVEVLARRGKDALRYGPMKPVGLVDPRTGRRPWAVAQLRQDNAAGNLFNLVGFQTQLKFSEQKRVFSLIPGLQSAEFVRLGVMHQNLYLASPTFLEPSLQWRGRPDWFAAGTLVGVEGYTEAVATGLLAGINLARQLRGQAPFVLPPTTMLGALTRYIAYCDSKHFQPMNANWGLIEPLNTEVRDKKQRRQLMADRAIAETRKWLEHA